MHPPFKVNHCEHCGAINANHPDPQTCIRYLNNLSLKHRIRIRSLLQELRGVKNYVNSLQGKRNHRPKRRWSWKNKRPEDTLSLTPFYHEGLRAGLDGKQESHCPYGREDPRRYAWCRGVVIPRLGITLTKQRWPTTRSHLFFNGSTGQSCKICTHSERLPDKPNRSAHYRCKIKTTRANGRWCLEFVSVRPVAPEAGAPVSPPIPPQPVRQ